MVYVSKGYFDDRKMVLCSRMRAVNTLRTLSTDRERNG